eukprot:g9341.t1
MQSLVLMDDSYSDMGHGRPTGPATGDRHLLPLGLVQKPSAGGAANGAAPRHHKQTSPARPTVNRCPYSLPPQPEGPPVMVLFPATLHLAIFFVPAQPATLASAVMTLLVILGEWVWGWGTVSTAGAGSGIAAGFVVGLGVRSWPVGGWGSTALLALGVALQGGGRASVALSVSLILSTFWRNGWWLYLQPQCGPVWFMLSGMVLPSGMADVSLGFLLSSLLQVHETPPSPQPKEASRRSVVPQPETHDSATHRAPPVQGDMWSAVTPPGLAGLRGRRLQVSE